HVEAMAITLNEEAFVTRLNRAARDAIGPCPLEGACAALAPDGNAVAIHQHIALLHNRALFPVDMHFRNFAGEAAGGSEAIKRRPYKAGARRERVFFARPDMAVTHILTDIAGARLVQ